MKKKLNLLAVVTAFFVTSVSFAQSIEFVAPIKNYIPKAQSIPGYSVKYTAKKPGTIYLGIKKDGKAIGNSIYKVEKAGSETIDMSLWIWEGTRILSKANYSIQLSMWSDPENVFKHKAAEAATIENVTLGKPKKTKKKKSKKRKNKKRRNKN